MAEHADERGGARASSSQVAPRHDNELVPKRVREALSGASDFGTFRERRAFSFLHLFSGPNDVLGKAVYAEATKEGLTVDVTAVDVNLPQAPSPGAGGRVGRDPWRSSVRHLLEGKVESARSGSGAGKKQERDLRLVYKQRGPAEAGGRRDAAGLQDYMDRGRGPAVAETATCPGGGESAE